MLFIIGDTGGVGNRGVLVVWQLTVAQLVGLIGVSFVVIGSVLIALSFVVIFSDGPVRCIL